MKTKTSEVPKFQNESEEADWWSSRAGKLFVKQKSIAAQTDVKPPAARSWSPD